MDYNPLGSSVHGILQARILEWVIVGPSPNHVLLLATPWTAARQASLSLTISWSLPKFMFIALVMPSNHLILWYSLLLLPLIFPSIRTFPMSDLFASDDQNTGASASASILPVNNQGWSPWRLTGLISLLSKGLSEVFSSPTGIDSSAFCLLYGPALTTVGDHWEDLSLGYTDLCWQCNVSAFQQTVWVCHCFPAKKQLSSDFMAAVTVHSDFGAQEEDEDLPDPGIEPRSPELQVDSLLCERQGKPQISQEAKVKLLPEYLLYLIMWKDCLFPRCGFHNNKTISFIIVALRGLFSGKGWGWGRKENPPPSNYLPG